MYVKKNNKIINTSNAINLQYFYPTLKKPKAKTQANSHNKKTKRRLASHQVQ